MKFIVECRAPWRDTTATKSDTPTSSNTPPAISCQPSNISKDFKKHNFWETSQNWQNVSYSTLNYSYAQLLYSQVLLLSSTLLAATLLSAALTLSCSYSQLLLLSAPLSLSYSYSQQLYCQLLLLSATLLSAALHILVWHSQKAKPSSNTIWYIHIYFQGVIFRTTNANLCQAACRSAAQMAWTSSQIEMKSKTRLYLSIF